jgi:hypothetical protein
MKVTVENTAAATLMGGPHGWLMRTPAPPATKRIAATTHARLARFLVVLSPRSLEKAHEPSGQIIPGRSSKRRALCPKYNR